MWYGGDKKYDFLAILDFNAEELKKVGKEDKYMSEFKKRVEDLNNNIVNSFYHRKMMKGKE